MAADPKAQPRADAPLRPVTPIGILSDRLGRLQERLHRGELRAAEVDQEVAECAALARGLDPYLEANATPESPALADLAEATRSHSWRARNEAGGTSGGLEAEMLSGHVEGRFLAMLVSLMRARSVLEIGMFTGYSALAMAEALPAEGHVVACELDPYVAAFARNLFDRSPHGEKIDVRVGPALESLDALDAAGHSFDLVFVDADKAGYAGYLERLLRGNLLAPRGCIAVDNTLYQGEVYVEGPNSANGQAIAGFNRRVSADPDLEQVLLPLRDGVTLIRRTVA